MKRPLLYALGFLVTGIVIGRAPAFAAYDPILLFGLSLGLGLLFCGFLYRVYRYKAVFAFVLFLLLGLLRVDGSIHSYVTEPVYVEFHGVVMDVGRTSGGNQRAIIRGNIYGIGENTYVDFHESDVNQSIYMGEYGGGYRFRVMAYIRPHQPQVVLGQEVIITGYLQPLQRADNPGGYDQFQHLRSQKVDASVWPDAVILGEVRSSLTVVLRRFRDRLADVYDNLLPSREAGVIKSMILGDRLDMDQDLAGQYRRMGIFHILSISGMHVTILTMAAFSLLKLVMPERRAGVLVLVVMIAYCLMTGAAVPTVRAVTMGGLLVLGRVLYRDYDLLASVSLAGIVLLIYEPLYLFNVAFQLSFGAVFGIGILKAPIERGLALLRLPKGKLRESLSVGIAAVVASYIVFAHHLYEIPLYSVLGNLVIMPTVTVLLVLGVLVGLIGLVWLPGAYIIAGPVYFILRFYELASSFFASLPGAMAIVGGGSLAVTGLGVGVVLAFAYAFSGFGDDFKKRLVLFFSLVLVLIGAVFVRDFPLDLRVTALRTHGEYVVLRHRGDMLVVGNARGGEAVLLRYMDMRGVSRAHGLILTTPPRPADIRRLEGLLPRIQVLYLPGGFVPSAELRDGAAAHGVEIMWLYDGYVLEMGRANVHAETGLGLSLGVSYGDSMISFVLDSLADVVISEGVVTFGERAYPMEYYGAVLLRTNGRRIRYWVYNHP